MYDLSRSKLAAVLDTLQPSIADIGARGGLDEDLLAVAWASSVYGFEPEPNEVDRLKANADLRWKKVVVLPYAVGALNGKSTLHIPASPQGASLLPHNAEMVDNFGYDNLHIVHKEISVETVTLDRLRDNGELPSIDYMKIDIEGAELDVLRAGLSVLRDCSALKIECSFLPQRLLQPLIWEVVPFMIDAGFDVVDIHDIHRWRRRPLPAHPYVVNFQMPYSRGQLAQCDLIFLRRPETIDTSNRMKMLIVVASALGYFDYGINALRCNVELCKEIQNEYRFNFESELANWAKMTGRFQLRKAIYNNLRSLVPQIRSLAGLLPYTMPTKPY